MTYCKYHPLLAATYECTRCTISHCDQCAGDTDKYGNTLCHFCQQPMESLGTAGSAPPFWRRLPESFRYPMNSNALPVIIGVSLVTTFLTAVPLLMLFSLVIYFALIGAMLKYSFRCLERTAAGEMSAPNTGDAFSGGLGLLLKLIVILILLGAIIGVASAFIHPSMAGLLGTLVMVSLPAMLIRFAESEEVFDTLNPLNTLQLIAAIGLPYGVLIAFIMIMMGSVGVINALIGEHWFILSRALQSIVSNYYMIVIFHIMGYMLFQYQGKLGYTARADDVETPRDGASILLAKIDINIKEGFYDKAIQLFENGIKQFPDNKTLAQNYFNFAYNTRRKTLLKASTQHYLDLLAEHREYDTLNITFTTANRICPGIMPATPHTRLQLAKACRTKGDPTSAVKLLNGLHKTHPKFTDLGEAYTVLANALEDLNMQSQADKCRAMAERLAPVKPSQGEPTSAPERFTARELSSTPPPQKEAKTSNTPTPPPKNWEDTPKDLPPIEFK